MHQSDENSDRKDEARNENQPLKSYARYTGMAFQMMGIIAVFAFAGYKIDEWYGHKVQWVTALACVLGVCLSIYQIIRQLKE
ncbi:AtpZ/AtpI family protein [Daejeonella sp. H1SJ63]|jgi:F0F1-type ATP synthase assembly protein I|uniref:AtpZ/AtpI family protein n=1 Tax=Daejeonella sp. H1SJ63 TaxID=3034145 RepID=UPI0023EDDAF8|nr:AtpZ/AtpI family protein [Daejeonella sp. H1SJ63]